MKKARIDIIKIILIYLLFIIALNSLCALALKPYFPAYPLYETIICLLKSNSILDQIPKYLGLVIIVKELLENIALAILASYMFAFILNRGVKIIFPDSIILRRRTSEGSNGKLKLGILIGNPSKQPLFDIKCCLHCAYTKNSKQKNTETYLYQTVEYIQNYYRFSFDIEDIPKTFWQHYLERGEEYIDEDYIQISISGKTNGLGGYFRATRQYRIQDIVIDVHEPEKYFKKTTRSFLTGEEQTKIDWKAFPKSIVAGVDTQKDIIDEIKNLVGDCQCIC